MKARIIVKTLAVLTFTLITASITTTALADKKITFPEGTATPSETCGACHNAIHREFAFGFGSDIHYKQTTSKEGEKLPLPTTISASSTSHAFAGSEPFPLHLREAEEAGKSCNVCHFPEPFTIPDLNTLETVKPAGRPKEKETAGITCASCHLTPEGKIRGPYSVKAPHETVVDPAIQTSAMCAFCHSLGQRAINQPTQTFLEWREDFNKPGLGKQHCQDCHMPRTIRKVAEDFDTPDRAVARHLWTGGRSQQRLASALGMVILQPDEKKPDLSFHVINIGAGHSVPTGSDRRAIYLMAEIMDKQGQKVATKEWTFALRYEARPDDKKSSKGDNNRPDAATAAQTEAQPPHESSIRAGEERVLLWTPELQSGDYTIKARLIYDLNRSNNRSLEDDQTEINSSHLRIKVQKGS